MRERKRYLYIITNPDRLQHTCRDLFNYLQFVRILLYYIFLTTPDIDTIMFRWERYLTAIDIINIGTARPRNTDNMS